MRKLEMLEFWKIRKMIILIVGRKAVKANEILIVDLEI